MDRGFESSVNGRLAPDAVLECGVCWWVYDPREGDESRDIHPGVAFADLPSDWRCPSCDNAKSKFMVRDAGTGALSASTSAPAAPDTSQEARVASLLRAYEVAEASMVGLPVHNPALLIEAMGFRPWELGGGGEAGRPGYAGVIITPWCMNLTLVSADPHAGAPGPIGGVRSVGFPSGTYSFVTGRLDGVGFVETCSLFSPMDEFDHADVARTVAQSAIEGLFEIPEPPPPAKVTRRFLLTRSGAESPGVGEE